MENITTELEVRKLVRVFLEHWWWFIISGVISLSLGFLYFLRVTPTWETDASIILRLQEMTGNRMEAISILGISTNSAADDEEQVISSRGLMAQSLDALNLWEPTFIKDGMHWLEEYPAHALSVECVALKPEMRKASFMVTVKPTRSGYKVKAKAGMWKRSVVRVKTLDEPIEMFAGTIRVHAKRTLSPDTTYRVQVIGREALVADYGQRMEVKHIRSESNILTLSIRSSSPARDKALLAKLIEQYNINAIVDKNMIASNTAAFINDRMNNIELELVESEKAVSEYKEKHNIANIDMQSRLFIEAGDAEQRAITEIETQLTLIDYVDGFIRDESNRTNLIPANLGIKDAALETSLSEYNAILLHRMRLQRTATDSNPVLEQMDQQLASMRQHIIATIASVRGSMQIRLKSLEEQDTKYNRQIKDAPEREREYVRVVRDQKIKEQLYLYLYQKREENALMLAATSMPAKILDAPQQVVYSHEPRLIHVLLICILLAFLFPAAWIYTMIFVNKKVDDEKEFEQKINAPILGHVSETADQQFIAVHEGKSTLSDEQFRSVRTNLRFVLPSDVKSPVMLVSSYINGDGKTYVAMNMALSLAILGKKVVLVGMDLRRPRLAAYLGLSNQGCLTDYLAETGIKLEDTIIPSREHKNLDLIPCGTVPPNPAELLQADRTEELFTELRKHYDYILVDTAPLAYASDTYLLDRIANLIIVVSRFKYTPFEMVEYVNRAIEQKRLHNVVCLLNGVKGLKTGYEYGQ